MEVRYVASGSNYLSSDKSRFTLALQGYVAGAIAPTNAVLNAGQIRYDYNVNNGVPGFTTTNNANGVLTINTHNGDYYHQLGFSSNGGIFHHASKGTTGWVEIVKNSGTWGISITGNAATATSLTSNAGSTTQPIYFTGGKPSATSYSLSATINAGDSAYVAYYSGANAISSAKAATGMMMPAHYYHNLYNNNPTTGTTVYVHYYNTSTTSTNSFANLRVKTSSSYKTLAFGGDGNLTWEGHIKATAGYLYSTANSNTVTIGSQNTSWCHFDNSANIPFYFGKNIHVNSQLIIYNTGTKLYNNYLEFAQGGGWYMSDATYLRSYNNKSIYTTGTIYGGETWGYQLRLVSNWLGFYANALNTTTRYGYIQCNADRMYFRKENSSSQNEYFDFGSRIYTPSISVGYTNTSYVMSTNSFICNSWVRTKGSAGWYNEDYAGGWYMTDTKWIRSYNSKPTILDIGTNNAYGIGGHRLALAMVGGSNVSWIMKGGSVIYGFCVNGNGNWYFGRRTNDQSLETTTNDAYGYYGDNVSILPNGDNVKNLGNSSNRWKEVRAVNFYGYFNGNVSGSSSSCTGNAATATKLATARNLWGNSFNGTADISGTLTPGSNNGSNLGSSSLEWSGTYSRVVYARHFDSSANYTSDRNMYYGYNRGAAHYFYKYDGSTRTHLATIDGNLSLPNGSFFARVDSGEAHCEARNATQRIYLYAHSNGSAGIYRVRADGTAHSIIYVGNNSSTSTFYGNCTGSSASCTGTAAYAKRLSGGTNVWDDGSTVFIGENSTSKIELYGSSGACQLTGRLWINYSQDVGLNQNGAFIIGPKDGKNMALDPDEIMARNNSAASPIYINWDGGQINCGGYVNMKAGHNDYAECRKCSIDEPGRVVVPSFGGISVPSTERLQAGARIISDTFGFSVGESDEAKTRLAMSGRVLAYPYRPISEYHIGDAVCSAPNGTVDIMTREEIKEYPERIIGIVNEIPTYNIWRVVSSHDTNPRKSKRITETQVKGRIWIDIK